MFTELKNSEFKLFFKKDLFETCLIMYRLCLNQIGNGQGQQNPKFWKLIFNKPLPFNI